MRTKRFAVLFVALLVFGAAVAGFAAKPSGSGSKAFAVSFSFRDAASDRIQSDVPGSQQPYQGAEIKITNDPAALQMVYNGGGSIYFDFSASLACPASGCGRPFGQDSVATSFAVSECSQSSLANMALNDAQLCAFKPNPGDPQPDKNWRLRFDPTPFLGGGEPDERSGTRVTVTCVAAGADNTCSTWTIEGASGAREEDPDTDIGSLLSVPSKGRLVETWEGSYSMPFQMTVTKQ